MSLWSELKRRNVIRVAAAYVLTAWLVVQVVETIFPAFGFGDTAVRFVVVAFAAAFIPALVLAWVFEWTPGGLKKDAEVDRERPLPKGTYKAFDRVLMVVLAVAAGFFAFDKFVLEPARNSAEIAAARAEGRTEAIIEAYGDQSIAVIPFVNLSSNPEQTFFADGVAEEVLNLLAKIPELRVISRSSSFTFRGADLNIPEIAARLNVAHILEGSVRASGNRIRITAQLIEAKSDTHLWSETYDRTLDDIFAIQDEIASNIVDNLHVELLGPMPRARRTDPQALAMFLQAKQVFFQSMTQDSWVDAADRMEALLDAAVEIDPDFTDAIAWYSYVDWMRGSEGIISKEETRRRREELNARVLAIDPYNATILVNRAWDLTFYSPDLEAAVPLWERAYRSAPNDDETLRQVGRFAAIIGRYDVSHQLLERAVSVNPLCAPCLYWLSVGYMISEDWDKAEQARERYLLLGGTGGYYFYGIIKMMQGDARSALEIFDGPNVDGYPREAGRAMALHVLGDTEQSEAALARLTEPGSEEHLDYLSTVANVHAFLKRKDEAFEWLERSLQLPLDPMYGKFDLVRYAVDPLRKSLHDDPRWEAFLERVGMPSRIVDSLEFSIDISQRKQTFE